MGVSMRQKLTKTPKYILCYLDKQNNNPRIAQLRRVFDELPDDDKTRIYQTIDRLTKQIPTLGVSGAFELVGWMGEMITLNGLERTKRITL